MIRFFFITTVLVYGMCSAGSAAVFAEPLPVRTQHHGDDPDIDQLQKKYNSHIDNQAYLDKLQQRRAAERRPPSPVILQNNRRPCRYAGCASWGIEYRSGSDTFIYYEGYRPNAPHRTHIYPRVIPYKKKYPHRSSPKYRIQK